MILFMMTTAQTSPLPIQSFVQPGPTMMLGPPSGSQHPSAMFAQSFGAGFGHVSAPPGVFASQQARSNSFTTQSSSLGSMSQHALPFPSTTTTASTSFSIDQDVMDGKRQPKKAKMSTKAMNGGATTTTKKKSIGKNSAIADQSNATTPQGTKRKMTPMSAFRTPDPQSSTTTAASSSASKKKAEKFKRNSRACTYCQRLKMKCSGPTVDGPCERCRRTGRECLVQERAPRRPWTKKKDMQIQQLTDRLEEMEAMLRTSLTAGAQDGDAELQQAALKEQAELAGLLTSGNVAGPSIKEERPNKLAKHIAPPAHTGPSPNAIANWLTLTNAPTTPSAAHELDLAYVDGHREQLPFVASGKISPAEAVEMFHLFMTSCVLHTVILDPEWHTVPRVGDASPFLFSVILYIAATYHRERRNLRSALHDEMNALIGQSITSGPKSIEVVQGFLLLYQWNTPSADPADDRAWLLSGVALRLATEMQLHRAQKRLVATHTPLPTQSKLNESADVHGETDRERINRERCWLMAFCVDRSLSFAVGRSWTISEKAALVRDSDKWCKQKASRPWDQGICAFADLLKTTSRQADVLHTAVSKWGDHSSSDESENYDGNHANEAENFDCETMMRLMNDELETWRRRWLSRDFFALTAEISPEAATAASAAASDRLQAAASSRSNSVSGNQYEDAGSSSASSVTVHTEALDVHLRTLYYITKQAFFRFNFAVLVMNSFGLQYCATRPHLTHARTFCITHAVRAAQGLVRAATDGIGATMTYAPHTQFTILSFGVISLIKLASLVDDVVAARLIDQVNGCVGFLERIAIASDHTPARLASLVRAMLRKREEQAERQQSSGAPGASSAALAPQSTTVKKDVSKNSINGAYHRATSEDQIEADLDHKPAYAPGMEIHKLPQRSSRAVTPEPRSGNYAPDDFPVDLFHVDAVPPPSSSAVPAAPSFAWPSADELIPSLTFDEDVEATLQSLGLASNIGTAAWSNMSAEEILDDSFWLRLPERQNSVANGSST